MTDSLVMDRVATAASAYRWSESQSKAGFWRNEVKHVPAVLRPRAASAQGFSAEAVDRLQTPTRAHALRRVAYKKEKALEERMDPNETATRLAWRARQASKASLEASARLARCPTRSLSAHVVGYLEQYDNDIGWPSERPTLVSKKKVKETVNRLYSTPINHAKPAALADPPKVRLGGNYDYLDEGWYNRARATRKHAVPEPTVYPNGTYYPDVREAMKEAASAKAKARARKLRRGKPKQSQPLCDLIEITPSACIVSEILPRRDLLIRQGAKGISTSADLAFAVDLTSKRAADVVADTFAAAVTKVSKYIARDSRVRLRIGIIGYGNSAEDASVLLPLVLCQEDEDLQSEKSVVGQALNDVRDAHRRVANAAPDQNGREESFERAMLMLNRIGFDVAAHNSAFVVCEIPPVQAEGVWLTQVREIVDQNVSFAVLCREPERHSEHDREAAMGALLEPFHAKVMQLPTIDLVPAAFVAVAISSLDERAIASSTLENTKVLRPLLDPDFVGPGMHGIAAGIATHAHFSRWTTTKRQISDHVTAVLRALLGQMNASKVCVRQPRVFHGTAEVLVRRPEDGVEVPSTVPGPHIQLELAPPSRELLARWMMLLHEDNAIVLDEAAYNYVKRRFSALKDQAVGPEESGERFGPRFAARLPASQGAQQRSV